MRFLCHRLRVINIVYVHVGTLVALPWFIWYVYMYVWFGPPQLSCPNLVRALTRMCVFRQMTTLVEWFSLPVVLYFPTLPSVPLLAENVIVLHVHTYVHTSTCIYECGVSTSIPPFSMKRKASWVSNGSDCWHVYICHKVLEFLLCTCSSCSRICNKRPLSSAGRNSITMSVRQMCTLM